MEKVQPIEGFKVMEWLRGVREKHHELYMADPEEHERKPKMTDEKIPYSILTYEGMRFYLDISVFFGLFDKEFQKHTHALFDFIEKQGIKIIHSDVLEEDLQLATQEIRSIANEKLLEAEYIKLDEKIKKLAEVYIKEEILTDKSINDARHIATATISGVDVMISWNFKNIANFMKIQEYNSINLKQGYGKTPIYSPMAIIGDIS
jgi:hypothetical protein